MCIFELFNICNFGGKENFSFCQFCTSTAKPLIAVIMTTRTCLRVKLASLTLHDCTYYFTEIPTFDFLSPVSRYI